MNVELLRKIQTHILEEPRRINMDMWFSAIEGRSLRQIESSIPDCGTVACIGGWACVLSGYKPINTIYVENQEEKHNLTHSIASHVLDLTIEQAQELFNADYWENNEKYKNYSEATTPTERAQAVSDYIDWFIAREG